MQSFACPRCRDIIEFTCMACESCRTVIGYQPDQQAFVALNPVQGFIGGEVRTGDPVWRRCLNAAWGCNWVLEASSTLSWCRSCALTGGRPHTSDPDALRAWMETECHKRHLLHQVAALGLPIEGRTPTAPTGLRFELVYAPGQAEVTGHRAGTITIDLTEADDPHRATQRHLFGEATRTMLGHLRHEIGHYYWPILVETQDELDEFRSLFGDERTDYRQALDTHHASPIPRWNPVEHLTSYAAAHPAEDWAETFAHYLHITDATETADAHSLHVSSSTGEPPWSFAALVHRWQETAHALNAVARSLGEAPLYPYTVTAATLRKLDYIDRRVHGRPA